LNLYKLLYDNSVQQVCFFQGLGIFTEDPHRNGSLQSVIGKLSFSINYSPYIANGVGMIELLYDLLPGVKPDLYSGGRL